MKNYKFRFYVILILVFVYIIGGHSLRIIEAYKEKKERENKYIKIVLTIMLAEAKEVLLNKTNITTINKIVDLVWNYEFPYSELERDKTFYNPDMSLWTYYANKDDSNQDNFDVFQCDAIVTEIKDHFYLSILFDSTFRTNEFNPFASDHTNSESISH